MPLQFYIYLAGIGLSVLMAALLLWKYHASVTNLPGTWKKSQSVKNYGLSICFLMIYLLLNLLGELVAIYLALHHTYNSYIYSIALTLSFPFFLFFLYFYTHTSWKKYVYFIAYGFLVGYFVWGGYYDPHSILPDESPLLIESILFISCLLHLTDLLMNPKSDHFKFQLKICVTFMTYSLLATIATTAHWSLSYETYLSLRFLFQLQFFNAVVFYYLLCMIFLIEILKLRVKREAKNA